MGQGAEYLLKKGIIILVFNIYIIYLFININIYVEQHAKRVISEILTIVILTADTLGYL